MLRLAVLLLLSGPASAPEPTLTDTIETVRPVAPKAAWSLAPAPSDCTLSRDYVVEGRPVTVGFRPSWDGNLRQVLIVTRPDAGGFREDTVRLRVGDKTLTADSTSGIIDDHRVTLAEVKDDILPDPRQSEAIAIQVGSGAPTAFALPGAKAAFAALDRCQDKLMDQLGIFPYERRKSSLASNDARVAAPVSSPANWLTNGDYPPEALRHVRTGRVEILWTIGIDGRVHDCKVLISSGFPELDRTSCYAVTKRGRYLPAKDASGNPEPRHASRDVVFRSED